LLSQGRRAAGGGGVDGGGEVDEGSREGGEDGSDEEGIEEAMEAGEGEARCEKASIPAKLFSRTCPASSSSGRSVSRYTMANARRMTKATATLAKLGMKGEMDVGREGGRERESDRDGSVSG
jgi:hypothetical protein